MITNRAVNLKFLNVQNPFNFPRAQIPEGTESEEHYVIKTQHKTDWLIGLRGQMQHLEVLALDDNLTVKGGPVPQAHPHLIAFG